MPIHQPKIQKATVILTPIAIAGQNDSMVLGVEFILRLKSKCQLL